MTGMTSVPFGNYRSSENLTLRALTNGVQFSDKKGIDVVSLFYWVKNNDKRNVKTITFEKTIPSKASVYYV